MHLLDQYYGSLPAQYWFMGMDCQEITGFALNHLEASPDVEEAFVYVVGVRPECRRRRIALAFLERSFWALYQIGK